LKVLHVFKTYLPDSFTGVERVIWEIAEGAVRHGIDSEVFYVSPAGHRAPYAVASHTATAAHQNFYIASTGLSLGAFGHFRERAATADLVHYHFPWPMMDLLDAAARHGKPSLVTYHSDIVKQRTLRHLYAPLMHAFLARQQAIVATSPNYVRTSPVLARYRDKVSAIPIGLDPARLAAPSSQAKDRLRQRLPSDFFLFLGALRYYKGLGFLFEAARATGLPIVVAGAGSLEPELAAAIPPNVTVLGAVDDDEKAALLERADGFVFPSHLRSEAFGVALLEAAFAGKAMISCELGTGTSYVNAHGETGLVVPPADAGALAQALKTLAADPGLRQRFGDAARARANALFTAETMTASYVALYRTLIGSPP
jgi:rhamnosyl/mannosyltransferase